jgi:hypothetical protein
MKMYVPEISDQIILSQDWTFDLYHEWRNKSLFDKMKVNFMNGGYAQNMEKYAATIPKGTGLKIDRIYIRKGNSEYSSLTFYIGSGPWKGCRFWAKLKDVNKIEFDEVLTTPNVKVSFSSSLTHSYIGNIYSPDEYKNWLRYKASIVDAKVNGKKLVSVNVKWEKENLTDEQVKIINAAGKKNYWYAKRTINDVQITKYELEAKLISTGEVLGVAKTSATLSKKIKDYFIKHLELITE